MSDEIILPKHNVKKIMKCIGEDIWIPDDAAVLMAKMAETYIMDATAKALTIARSAGVKKRIRKRDLQALFDVSNYTQSQ